MLPTPQPRDTPPPQPHYRIVFGSQPGPQGLQARYRLTLAATGKSRLGTADPLEPGPPPCADYQALIAALDDLLARIDAAARTPDQFHLEIASDSAAVVNQANGWSKAHDDAAREFCDQAREALARFASFTLTWIPRDRCLRQLRS